MKEQFEIKNGKIFSNIGIPKLPRWFCDDLVTIKQEKYGISEMQYFNPTTYGSERVFVADMWDGMKFYIDKSGEKYGLNLSFVEVMPYGFCGTWNYSENTFSFEQRVINNSVFISIKPIKVVDSNLRFSVEFYDAFCMLPRKDGDFRFVNKKERTWGNWSYEDDMLTIGYDEEGKNTYVCIGANVRAEYIKRTKGYVKHILNYGGICENNIDISISFDYEKSRAINRAKDTVLKHEFFIDAQNQRYDEVIRKSPVLKSKYTKLNEFFSLAPVYHESLKVLSVKGAIRAKTEHYWVWGWDGMSSSYAYTYWGDKEFIAKLLKMYMDTADSKKGIGHWFERDMSHRETSMISAQGFYINLLYQYYINGGDIAPYYEFAKKIFGLIESVEVDNLGLCSGNSLVPDFREVILENGNDISCFNNVSAYCAVRALEEIAKSISDEEIIKKASEFAKRTRDNFLKLLYNDEVGFYVSSADSKTHEQRMVLNAMAIKWDNKFCYELVHNNDKRSLEFFEKYFITKAGIRPFPLDGIGYDADANQAHCYWPAHSEYYARLINKEDRVDLIEQFIGWISTWTNILMCPEGISCYENKEEPFLDEWTSNNGTWQAYSMRAWYEATVHSIVGVDIDEKELTFYPYSGEEISLLGLHYKDLTLDIHMKGSGKEITNIVLNNKDLGGVYCIPYSALEQKNEIIVYRK